MEEGRHLWVIRFCVRRLPDQLFCSPVFLTRVLGKKILILALLSASRGRMTTPRGGLLGDITLRFGSRPASAHPLWGAQSLSACMRRDEAGEQLEPHQPGPASTEPAYRTASFVNSLPASWQKCYATAHVLVDCNIGVRRIDETSRCAAERMREANDREFPSSAGVAR